MKISRALFVIMLMCPFVHALSQSYTIPQTYEEFIVIDEIVENYDQLASEFGQQPHVYYTDGGTLENIEQLTMAVSNIQVEDVHIYAATKPGAIVFSCYALTTLNIEDAEEVLAEWSNSVTGQVVIHSEVVFTGDEGAELKYQLEAFTGLVFISQ